MRSRQQVSPCQSKSYALYSVHVEVLVILFAFGMLFLYFLSPTHALEQPLQLQKGHVLPQATVVGQDGQTISLESLKGQVTLISVVPQLNTPVCDEQTHRFSEQNDGLDQLISFVTMSTNSHQDQMNFAHKAHIQNMRFLSDAPEFEFGRTTGLLLQDIDILHRAVIVLDEQAIIRYVEIVAMSQLPNFEQAYRVVRSLIPRTS